MERRDAADVEGAGGAVGKEIAWIINIENALNFGDVLRGAVPAGLAFFGLRSRHSRAGLCGAAAARLGFASCESGVPEAGDCCMARC